MKKIIFSVCLFFTAGIAFGQTFMHGAGLTVFVGSSKGNDVTVGEGFTYYPRVNVVETEALSLSVGIPLTAGIGVSGNFYYSTGNGFSDNGSVGLILNAPLLLSLNMGRGSTKDNTSKLGYFFGGGFAYHHGDFLTTQTDNYGNDYTDSRSYNVYGPAAHAGFRIGVGRKHKNIEVRFSYMKGTNEDKPDIFGVGCLFNF
ncbi:MAG: hypothetical protein WDN26_10375 [Chitinophagaceae bacterium]